MKKPLVLIIMDGFGLGNDYGNAIKKADTPNLDRLFSLNPMTKILASGMAVGLPEGQMGNSEVGHTNIGAGKIVYQDFTRITKAINDGDFFNNEVLMSAINNAKENDASLHLMGLVSDGGVHSHIDHLYALLNLAKKMGVQKVYVHAFLDGRDTLPMSGINFISECNKKLKEIGIGKIATISGRYYAMDRDNRWDRVKKAYEAICGIRGNFCSDPVLAIEQSYKKGITDEFIVPTICDNSGTVKQSDSVVFFNFRPDRARELTRAFVDKDFNKFDRQNKIDPLYFVCMTQYDVTLKNVKIAFLPQVLKNTFSEYISGLGLTQLKIAETEKYAHVTFFFNGGVEKSYSGEDRILIPSPKVATYDLEPQMSAKKITDAAIEKINERKYDVVVMNFANCDMVGHTGDFNATVSAVETVDECVGRIVKSTMENNRCILITADHGNADKMLDESGKPFTAHTTNSVPFCVVGKKCKLKSSGSLSDIAPTMLEMLNIKKPEEMTGESLINR